MDVFLMIRRKKLTIFTDAKDTTSVLELKKIIEGILKVSPHNQQLFNKDNTVMEDDKLLQDYGINLTTAKAQSPATVGLAVRPNASLIDRKDNLINTGIAVPIYHVIADDNFSSQINFFRDENGVFEHLELTPYSAPPDLPDVMKSQESNGQEQSS